MSSMLRPVFIAALLATAAGLAVPAPAQDAVYGDFGTLAAGGFLDSRFTGTTFTERGVVFTIALTGTQAYTCTAVNSPNGFGTLTMTENGQITGP